MRAARPPLGMPYLEILLGFTVIQLVIDPIRSMANDRALFEDQPDHVNDEQEDDGDLEHEHQPIVLVLLEELIEVIERFELLVDALMPVGKVKSRGQGLIDAC